MSWSEADIPDQSGRVAVITGANDGLGFELARALAWRGAHVVMAVRDQHKATLARQRIRAVNPNVRIEIRVLDLASLASVEACAAEINDTHAHLDLLVNNAGVMATPELRTTDGFELQLATNHLGHFVLTARLLPALLRGEAARIVSVTSTARHLGASIDPRNPHLTDRYGPWRAYGQSKLANLHFGVELQRRLAVSDAPAFSVIAHPGLSGTGLQTASVASSGGRSQRFFHALARTTGMPPRRAALSLLRAASDPGVRGGTLYAPRFVNVGPPVHRPLLPRSRALGPARRLWTVSELETGVTFDVAAMVAQGAQ